MKRPSLLFRLSLLCSLLAGPATATTMQGTWLTQARQQFLAAETALDAGNIKDYQQLKSALTLYPLLPYLEYQELKRELPALTSEQVFTALEQLSDTPLADSLGALWLELLAKRKDWENYLAFSKPGGTVTQQCWRLQAMIASGQSELAYSKVEPLWLSGKSRPKACDPVFESWIDNGGLSEELTWRRIELAMTAGRTRLARYLKRFLPEDQRNWVEQWITLHRRPEKILQLLDTRHPKHQSVCVHTIRRLAAKDLALAIEVWQRLQSTTRFSDTQHLRVARSMASRLMRLQDSDLAQQLNDLVPAHLRLDTTLTDRQFQAALQQNDWNRVLTTIDALPPKARNDERWLYWRGRALIELGAQDRAGELLLPLAQQRSYYGFLAAHHLGKAPNIEHQALDIPLHQVERLAKLPGLRRARELMLLERPLQARREWNLALHEASDEELKGAARLAQLWDWPSQAIMTLARLRHWNDLELRFPLNHLEQIDRQARDHDIDKAWIYAILRQESAFITDARSSAGALGLMQLMPNTAKEVASKSKLGPVTTEDLLQPGVNIELGASYLSEMYRKLQENPVLATAAYNAGPHRVEQWLPQASQATDIWIETVPFRETRKYLKRVIAYTLIYTHRLGESPKSLPKAWLKPVEAAITQEAGGQNSDSDA